MFIHKSRFFVMHSAQKTSLRCELVKFEPCNHVRDQRGRLSISVLSAGGVLDLKLT